MTALIMLWAAVCAASLVCPFLATRAAFNPPAWPTRAARAIRAAARAYAAASQTSHGDWQTRAAAGGW